MHPCVSGKYKKCRALQVVALPGKSLSVANDHLAKKGCSSF